MDTKEIQTRLDALPSAMAAKGKRLPDVQFRLRANASFDITLQSAKPGAVWADDWHYIKGDSIEEALDAADLWIKTLPTAEEARMKEFMTALSDVIELGRKSGVEVDFVNPLVETMKRLSSNIITDQRAATTSPQ